MVERYAVYEYVWIMHDISWFEFDVFVGMETLRTEMGRLWVAKCHLFGFKLVFLPNPCCSAQKWLPFAWHGSFPLLHWRVRRFQRWVRGWCQMQTKLLTWQMLRGTVAEKLALRLLNVCKDTLCATSVGRGWLQRACQMWSQFHTDSTFLAIIPASQRKDSRNNKLKNNILMNRKFTMWCSSGFKFIWALPEDPTTPALRKIGSCDPLLLVVSYCYLNCNPSCNFTHLSRWILVKEKAATIHLDLG